MENKPIRSNQQQVALVAGATGFIGRFLIAELLRQEHQVFALVRNQTAQQPILESWLSEKQLALDKLTFIQGDVTQLNLGISAQDWNRLATVNTLYNSSALFAWNLSMQQAHAVNVEGTLNLLRCVQQHCTLKRAVHMSGYMLTIKDHLYQAGVYIEQPERTDWQAVYQRLGAYEASKIEANFAWIQQAQGLSVDWTIIHPATVIGDELTGEIPANQPIVQLVDLLKRKKMSAIPATPQHYLPLVRVDDLCRVMLNAATDTKLCNQALLVAAEQHVPMYQLIQIIADQLGVSAPTQHVPIGLLKIILKWRWLAQKLEMSGEMLSFPRTEQLDLKALQQFRQRWNIQSGHLEAAIRKTTDWINHGAVS